MKNAMSRSQASLTQWCQIVVVVATLALAACVTVGPGQLQEARLRYNETVKTSTEEQLLLNLVRLRYGESPSSLAVSTIAAQYEQMQTFGLTPFFTASGADVNRAYTSVLPQAGVSASERPTFSLTPLDDQDFARKLFTPLPRDALLYLTKTTWPISTVFRLFLENMNWISNAETASGPTPAAPPEFQRFRRGVEALAAMQRKGWIVVTQFNRFKTIGAPMKAHQIDGALRLEINKTDLELRETRPGQWSVGKVDPYPVLRISPRAHDSAEMRALADAFDLEPNLPSYELTEEELEPFGPRHPRLHSLDMEPRSTLQAWYYASHGIDVPESHLATGIARRTTGPDGQPFDWSRVTEGLFHVRSAPGPHRPTSARIAVPYRDHWFWIDDADHDTKSTFALLLEVSRLELNTSGSTGTNRPVLTLPISGH